MTRKENRKSTWTFMTNHSHVLLCLSKDPSMLAREIALQVGITERAVLRILKELDEEGYVTITKKGRCNTYQVNAEKPLKHSIEEHCTIGAILELLKKND